MFMKDYYFVAALTAHLKLNEDEFNLLFSEAGCHYDFQIQSITKVGGFLYGFRNRRLFAKESGQHDEIVEFTESQLNLLMKAMEMNNTSDVLNLKSRLHNIFIDLQRQTVEVNKPLNKLEFTGHFTDR